MFKIGEIRELIRLLDETSIAELRVELEDMKLHLKKADVPQQVVSTVPVSAVAPSVLPAAQQVVQAEQSAETKPSDPAPAAKEAANIHTITSPMVGTFYRASSPDAQAFVEVGSQIHDKSIVCIVEAMKLMNEIEAEIRGEVVEILAENGQLVEYGQPLFKIRLT